MHWLDVGEVVKPLCGILASTARVTFTSITVPAREGTAALPYAENSSSIHIDPTFITIKRDNA